MNKYTKAPWKLIEEDGDYFILGNDGQDLIVDTFHGGNCTEAYMNARLIACAPELLEALKELLPMQFCITCQELCINCDRHGNISETIKKCEKAIAKAEGKII